MSIIVQIKNGSLYVIQTDKIREMKEGYYEATLEPKGKKATSAGQNRAIHRYFDLISEELNAKNISISDVLRKKALWTPVNVKENIWKPVQTLLTKKTSTRELTTEDINKIQDKISAGLQSRCKIKVSFPTIEGDKE